MQSRGWQLLRIATLKLVFEFSCFTRTVNGLCANVVIAPAARVIELVTRVIVPAVRVIEHVLARRSRISSRVQPLLPAKQRFMITIAAAS